jgi:hypothetical protein
MDAHPDLVSKVPPHKTYIFVHSDKELRDLTRALGGRREKRADDSYFMVKRDFGGGVCIELNLSRSEVCERLVIGVEHVGETVVPAKIIPAHDEEIIEWDCPPALLAFDEDPDGSGVRG